MLGSETIVGVAGAGAMGSGIAQIAAQAGHQVVVLDQSEEALAKGRASVATGLSAAVKRGRLAEAEARAVEDRLHWTIDIGAFAGAGLVVEAIVESAPAKQALFRDLEAVLGDAAAIATNTSSLSVTGLAAGLKRPQRFVGLHFFNPAPVMKLVEIVPGAETDPALVSAALHLMSAWGKRAVIARDVPGFIVNRVARPFYGEGWRALEEGAADAETIDFLYRDLAGFRMGPFELGDLIGHDVNYAAATSIFAAYFGRTRFTPSLMQGQLVAAGRLGQKSGRGVYPQPDGKPAAPAAAGDARLIARLIEERRCEQDGVVIRLSDGRPAWRVAAEEGRPAAVVDQMRETARAIAFAASDQRSADAAAAFARRAGKRAVRLADRPGLIVLRTLLQLANCAADAVRDRVADAESIDAAMLNGVNYPIGPLAWVRDFGLAKAVAALDFIAEETGESMYRPGEWLRAAAGGACRAES